MRDYSSPRDQVFNGIYMAFWLLSRPFVWVYILIKWFIVSITKETGGKLVKIIGGLIALTIIAYAYSFLGN